MSIMIFDILKGYSTNEVIKFLMYHEFPIIPLNISKYSIDKFESGLSRIAYLSKLKLYASFINFAKNERIFSQYILSFDMNKTYQYHRNYILDKMICQEYNVIEKRKEK